MNSIRRLVIALGAAAVLIAGLQIAPAAIAKSSYVAKPGKKCRHGYRRKKRHGRAVCVKRSAKPAAVPAPKLLSLHTHLHPEPVRTLNNPADVHYQFDAFATDPDGAVAETPSGVSALFVDGSLLCAINVAAANGPVSNECDAAEEPQGEHTVTTIYSAGARSAADTAVYNFTSVATTTQLTVTFVEEAPQGDGDDPNIHRVGSLLIDASRKPGGTTSLSCFGMSSECLQPSAGLDPGGHLTMNVYRGGLSHYIGLAVSGKSDEAPETFSAEEMSSGQYFLHVRSENGYPFLGSEASAPIVIPETPGGD